MMGGLIAMSSARPSPLSENLSPPPPEMTESQVRLEREKLALEREMLALERERMEAEREQWKRERELLGETTSGLHVGLGVFGIAVAVALVVAGMIGFNSGLEAGRHQAPLPRHVVVSREFLNLLARTQPLPRPPDPRTETRPGFDWLALYRRPPEARGAGNILLLR